MTVALIVAAGSGERLGAGRPKALVELAGRPLVQWSIDALRSAASVAEIVVAMPPGAAAPAGVTAVAGGAARSQSVRLALQAAGAGDAAGGSELVLVHDAARPLLTGALAERVIAALRDDGEADAAIAAVPVTDTVKQVDAGQRVVETLDRSHLWSVQTPQVFRRAALERALDAPAETLARATDDAWLIERGGGRVIVVRGDERNLKVTTPLDLRVAELLLAERTR
ncbi:MAG TPA: 2-C-methyl-D-erythritol 4-phosphate cytidylyltransferase [Solirubrobacteraceae bacterium]|jgi:2-C-methyl-D-erythritol 4-phosphate cytidylyltransferase|nr:2-C-methyl-D-erythritol 4-phosphate cytidylyltransferase [Solirubrobacteraceae bacterium]